MPTDASSGGVSAVKEPGNFEVGKSLIYVTRSQGRNQDFLWVHFISLKKVDHVF